ncbi:hypothetical protein CIK06_27655 [Plantactinospora sp. KBS50]|nr:hypothetical protein CIK06_27655 [Plantactinospora sp. KBS50]
MLAAEVDCWLGPGVPVGWLPVGLAGFTVTEPAELDAVVVTLGRTAPPPWAPVVDVPAVDVPVLDCWVAPVFGPAAGFPGPPVVALLPGAVEVGLPVVGLATTGPLAAGFTVVPAGFTVLPATGFTAVPAAGFTPVGPPGVAPAGAGFTCACGPVGVPGAATGPEPGPPA